MSDNLELLVDGVAYGGWLSVAVMRSLDQLASTFDLEVTERWHGQNQPVPIREGAECIVRIGDETAVTGFVDETEESYSKDSHTLRVSGRSSAGDLVDCAAVHSGQWMNVGLLQIVSDICFPFSGIAVSASANVDLGAPFNNFALHDGETALEAIERACRMRGVLVVSSASGDIELTRGSGRRTLTTLERGVNILKGSRKGSTRERFRTYTVKAQTRGTDQSNGIAAAGPSAVVEDDSIDRYRPTIVHAEQQADAAGLEKRAKWERNVRAGRAQRVSYTVPGWRILEGNLWAPNILVHVRDTQLRIDELLSVISARLTKSADGTLADLELVRPGALEVEPLTEQTLSGGLL